jgi:5'-nucleotidase
VKILATNDDGVHSDGLWVLVEALQAVGEVTVVAPDREQSAIGTALTHNQPLRAQKIHPVISGVAAWGVQGTPGDCVILAAEKLVHGKLDVVVSGINHGLNLGNDVLISGTVGAALQGYLRGLPSIAVSLSGTDKAYLKNAAQTVVRLISRISAGSNFGGNDGRSNNHFLFNLNVPDRTPEETQGIRITKLATQSHIDSVNEGHDGRRAYYWLARRRTAQVNDEETDIWAVEHGYSSLTPLHLYHGKGDDDKLYATLVEDEPKIQEKGST